MIPTSAHPCQDTDAHHDSAVSPEVLQTTTFFPFNVTPVPVEGSGESAVSPFLTEASAASASAASKSARHTVLLPQFSGVALGTSSESKPAAATAAPATLSDANRPADRGGRVTVEVFSGCCRLSKCLRQQGFDTLAVDVKEAQGHPVLKLDLLSRSGVSVLWDILKSGQVAYVHLAPPCSTSSAARSIPGGPPPLRSAAHPDGLPGLSFRHRCQVSNANKLYSLTAAVCRFCQESGIGWTLENPASSLFWATSSVAQLGRDLSACLHTCVFDSCCWGGNRKKRTALWSSLSCVQELSQLCHPGLGHTHSSWGRLPDGSWSTSAEAAYPMPLCRFWAAMIGKEYSLRLPAARVDSAVNWTPATGLYRARAGLGLFPRGRSPTEVTNPFSERLKIRVPLTTPATLLVPGSAAVLPGAPGARSCLLTGKLRRGYLA